MREAGPVTIARRKRQRGEPLDDGDREILKDYDAQFRSRQVKLSFPESRIAELSELASTSGYSALATFLRDHAERSIRGEAIDPETLKQMEDEISQQEEELQVLRRRNAQMQIELDKLISKVSDYADRFVRLLDESMEESV